MAALVRVEPAAGDLICFKGSSKKPHLYGVLAANMSAIAPCGSYLVLCPDDDDVHGELETKASVEVHIAWLRMNNRDQSSVYKANAPTVALNTMYAAAQANPEQLKEDIAASQAAYLQEFAARVKAVQEAKETQKKKAQGKPKKKAKKGATPTRMPSPKVPIGSQLQAYFLHAELFRDFAADTTA